MSDYFISFAQAENDLLSCAAFLAERIKSSDGLAEAMKTIIPRYLAKGNVDLAAELANGVDDPFSRDRLLTEVAEKCADLDDDEYALQLTDAIEDHGMQAQAFERVALVLAGKGNTEKAAEVADSMTHPDFVYAGIAVHQATGGDETAANATLGRIEFATARASALQQIAAAQISAKETEKALESLDRAVATASEIEHDEEKIRTLCDIGNLYIEAKRNDKAIETFEKARASAEILDNIHRDFFLVNCALGFLYSGSVELADRTLDLVNDKTQMASALLGFARDQWTKEEKTDAVETLEEAYAIVNSQRESETRDSRARNGLLASIAAQFAGFGKTDRGVEIALENQDPDEQIAALSQIAQMLVLQRQDELARQTVNLIKEDSNRLLALVALADGKQKLGEKEASVSLLDEAATLAETVPQLAARSGVLNEIAVRLIGHGETVKAREIAHQNLDLISEIRDETNRASELAKLSGLYEHANFEITDSERTTLQKLTRSA
ncbi:MAG: tetratricopeptide repeat protein [Pyrinomonadaceae bacterium]